MVSRIFYDDISDTASISSSESTKSSLNAEGSDSEQVSELSEDADKDIVHIIDPYQFKPVADDSDEDSYSMDSKDNQSSERLLDSDW